MSHPYFNAAGLPLAAGNGVANGGQVGGVGGGGDVSAKLEDLHAAAQAAAVTARSRSLQRIGRRRSILFSLSHASEKLSHT